MDRWQSLIDRQINNARQDGDFSNLPGEGQPLHLDDNPNTPEHLRLAHKILRDNDLAPDWIMLGKELEEQRALLLHDLRQAAAKYHSPTGVQTMHDTAWSRAQKLFRKGAEHYNEQVLSYNLKLPPGVSHKAPLDIEAEIRWALEEN